MKWIFFLFISQSVLAFELPCHEFKVKGEVRVINDRMCLIVRRGATSQTVFALKPEQELQLAPYLNQSVEGDFVVKGDAPLSSSSLMTMSNLKLTLLDTLFPVDDIKKQKVVKCPEITKL